jgi:NADH-quinone oxidoreductase subunit L
MTVPLVILAFFAVTLGVLGTPAWPWFRSFLEDRPVAFEWAGFNEPGFLPLVLTSTIVVFLGLALGWWFYGNRSPRPEEPDALERAVPTVWGWLRDRLYVDELYGVTVIAFYAWWARVADWSDRRVWGGMVAAVIAAFRGFAHFDRFFDQQFVDGGFDKGCEEIYTGGGLLARMQTGRVQQYLRFLALAVVVLAAILIWSARG